MFEVLLRRLVPHKELGWSEIDEKFTRFQLVKTPWFNIYLHKLECLRDPVHLHDHPWHFIALVLWGGYWEETESWTRWRKPGSVLWRKATFKHKVQTVGTNWSLVITTRKIREWKFHGNS